MNFILVENLDEVFAVAFEKSEKFQKKAHAKKQERIEKLEKKAKAAAGGSGLAAQALIK